MADDIFSANPRSLKMDVKSPLAVWLKAAVDDKLIEFLGDCTDDVLSEYVVILVFNGKHQKQARDDLEAFLGERSGEFVSWLWNLLLKIDKQSHLLDGSSNLKGVNTSSDCCVLMDTEQGNHRLQGLKNYAMGDADEPLSSQSKDKKYCPLKSASQRPSNFMEFSKGFQHLLPTFDTSICDLNIKNIKDLQAQSYEHGVVTRSGSVVDNHEVLKYESYGRKGSSNISSDGQ